MTMYVLFLAALEVMSGFAGVFFLVRSMAAIGRMQPRDEPEALWRHFLRVAVYGAAAAFMLTACVLLGGRSTNLAVTAVILPMVLVVVGFANVLLRLRARQPDGPILMPAAPANTKVVIRQLVAGRIRGVNAGRPIYFEDTEDEALRGQSGKVRMLSWRAALAARGLSGLAPLMGFMNASGASFLLYHDDDVVLVQDLV